MVAEFICNARSPLNYLKKRNYPDKVWCHLNFLLKIIKNAVYFYIGSKKTLSDIEPKQIILK